ncbi:MAG: arsenate reductase family protein [Bacilli bacterium]|jgi:arsenate reductase|nr:arsenate reductase family protein [Bacilli bacterium]
MNLFLWYPKCSTCKKAYQELQELNIDVKTRDIKEENPTKEELREWWKRSSVDLKKFFNTSGLIYKEQKLKEKLPNMTEEEQLELLASNGMLVKRPILITKDKIIIGYKEKNYQNLEG